MSLVCSDMCIRDRERGIGSIGCAIRILAFAPSSPIEPERVEAAIHILNREASRLAVAQPLTPPSKAPFTYLTGADSFQRKVFNTLLETNAQYLWAMRGGYGSLRWLGELNPEEIPPTAPPIIGFSDITFIHNLFIKRGIKTIHGPVLGTLDTTSIQSRAALYRALLQNEFPALQGRRMGLDDAQGRLIGGNLTCLCHSMGTPLEPPWNDSILLIEDHNESLYRLDRMLTHLLTTNRLRQLSGLAVGRLHDDNVATFELIKDRLGSLGIPIIYDLPVGHGHENMPLLLGAEYAIKGCELLPIEGAP